MNITEFAIEHPKGFYGYDETNCNNTNGIWNSAIYIDGKIYRERSEVLVLKGSNINNLKIFMRYINKHIPYRIPGGSMKYNKDILYTGIKETEEEARITVKDIISINDYIDTVHFQQYKLNNNTNVTVRYTGNFNHICVAMYDSMYTNEIPYIDSDPDMTRRGKFYKYKEVKSLLRSEHIHAIVTYLEMMKGRMK